MLSLKLHEKGLLIIAIPLIVVLVVDASLLFLLNQVEQAYSVEQHCRTVIGGVNNVMDASKKIAWDFMLFSMTRSQESLKTYEKDAAGIVQILNLLKSAIGDDAVQQKNYAKFSRVAAQSLALLGEMKTALSTQGAPNPLKMTYYRKEIRNNLSSLFEISHRMSEIESERAKLQPVTEAKARALVKYVLMIGIVLSVAMFFALVLYYSKDIVSRLTVLVDNSIRLATGHELQPVVKGHDEIAHLDGVFHEVAIALKEAKRKERAIIDNVQEVVCTIDANYMFSAVGPAASRVWGYSEAELLGQRLRNILAEDDVEKMLESLKSARSLAVVSSVEAKVKCKSGTIAWMLWSIYWSAAESSFFCVAHDINERKMLDRMKQDFVNMVSHDLRTPLTGMRAFLDTLTAGAYGNLSERGQSTAGGLKSSIGRLVNLVNELLDIEKMEAGEMRLDFAAVAPSLILKNGVDLIAGFAHQQKVELELNDLIGIDVTVVADGDRLVQVVQNLLSNAIKFSPQGSKVIISSHVCDGRLEIRIKDQGGGIPEEARRSIFDRYSQLDGWKDAPIAGTGLGLAICKAIIEQHQGEIGVDSTVGDGSTFWFWVPRSQKQ